MTKAKWIQEAFKNKKGALHKQLGYSKDETLPKGLMKEIYTTPVGNKVRGHKVTTLLKRRVLAAVNAQKWRHKK
jgi:hypothetical protein